MIIYGHTHHVKRIALGNHTDAYPVYLNTGTWADLMCVPPAIWGPEEGAARDTLHAFVEDLEKNQLTKWRRSIATYAKVEIDGDFVISADVYFAGNHAQVTSTALAERFTEERVYAYT